jgi:hypothetical protein
MGDGILLIVPTAKWGVRWREVDMGGMKKN